MAESVGIDGTLPVVARMNSIDRIRCCGCTLLLVGAVMLVAPLGAGELREGDLVLYYNVLNASLIAPQVAQRHGLARASDRGVLNLALRRDTADGLGEPVAAEISGDYSNLLGQKRAMEFIEVVELGARYYLAQFVFGHEDVLHFRVQVSLSGIESPLALDFRQQMYINP